MSQNTQTEPELATELPERQEKYPNLLKGGVIGHDGSNAGAPKSRVKQIQQQNSERFAKLASQMLDKIESGEVILSPSQIMRGNEVQSKIAFGEKSEIVLSSDLILSEISEVIGEWARESGIDGSQALVLLDKIIERLNDR